MNNFCPMNSKHKLFSYFISVFKPKQGNRNLNTVRLLIILALHFLMDIITRFVQILYNKQIISRTYSLGRLFMIAYYFLTTNSIYLLYTINNIYQFIIDIINLVGGMFSETFKRKKLEELLPKTKSTKNNKHTIDESLPSTIQSQKVSMQTKKLIYEMQEEYIKRYNILVANKKIYAQLIQNLSTELDWQGITPKKLTDFYKRIRSHEANDEKTQAE